MVDVYNDDGTRMQHEHEDILNTSLVSTSEFKSVRSKLVTQNPKESEEFMLMLKRFTNLLFALFVGSRPFYRQIKSIIDALRE